ncbi:hypothetical protein B0H63DRAFT_473908 [Podospora didyma]|uniref:CUE domain-containing protein n=1 Tax=Podospora didyma TaxID=330526 RepID=A0AAE0NQS3_9PEZI|nr:hypothetical protein B0H63DRAFT_473908 [Podospora didyma]
MASSTLPAFALFPIATWRDQVAPDEWVAYLDAWIALVDSHLTLSNADFLAISVKDPSLETFLSSFTHEVSRGGAAILSPSQSGRKLLKDCFQLASKLLQSSSPPSGLAQWEFIADLSRVYGKRRTGELLFLLSEPSQTLLDASLATLKKFLIKNLDAGLKGGDLNGIEERLERANSLIDASPSVAAYFLAGSDFLDGLISCYKIMNPPLRKVLIATTYLSLVGLLEGQKISTLTDQLYSLKAAADAHKAGISNANDSLVAELVTSTPLVQQLQRKLDESGSTSSRTKSVLADLATFKKPGGSGLARPKRLVNRRKEKGKGIAEYDSAQAQQEMHVHRMSQISQIQDLFPELGSGFVSKLLDEYGDYNTEDIISHLLEDSLPPHLQSADRSANLSPSAYHSDLAPRSTPPPSSTSSFPPLPTRHNIFDNDSLDNLQVSTAQLQLGKRSNVTADTVLATKVPNHKAAILSALAAFDSDDDERDDTYDAADVGGTVDTSSPDDIPLISETTESILYQVYTANPRLFGRDNPTRNSLERAKLRSQTGNMTDEAIEGWALMLSRDPQQRRRLQARYGEWTGTQKEIESTSWRANVAVDSEGAEDEASDSPAPSGPGPANRRGGGGPRGRGRGRGGGGRGGRGGGQEGGSGSPGVPDSELARRRKESSKGSRANHNRRDQRARKMARGGL